MNAVLIGLVIGALVLLLWQLSNLISISFGAAPISTPRSVIEKALGLVRIRKGDMVYDLGCGTGQVLLEANRLGTQAVGFEISPFYYFIAKIRTAAHPGIQVKYQNILTLDFSKANVIYCYLLPEILEKIQLKLAAARKRGTRIISVRFPIKNQSIKSLSVFDGIKVYLY